MKSKLYEKNNTIIGAFSLYEELPDNVEDLEIKYDLIDKESGKIIEKIRVPIFKENDKK